MSANSFESPDSTPATATQLPQSPPVQGDKLSDLQTPRLADASLPSSTAAIGTASAVNADNADDHSPVMPQEPKCAEPPMSPPPNRIDDMVKELQQIEVFHDEHKRPYASVLLGGHVEHLEIGSETFTQHLDAVAYRKWKRGLMTHQHDEVVSVLRAKAIHEGPTHPVHLRVAPGDSSLYIDLVDKDRWSVEVTAQGWTLTQTPPVRFCRPPMMAALPTPMRGGQINDLRPFLNCTDDGFKMIVGFILASFRAKGPYPILELVGEKGTSKSTTTRLVQALIDPSQGHLGSPISSEEQLAMRAKHSWLVTLDNCSGATDSLSDMLCRLATGGAFTKRELYTNTTQITMDYCRPCVINGIENIAKRADLLDRCWGWELSRIDNSRRKTEADLWADFAAKAPGIFGVICDALVVAVREENNVKLQSMDRLADAERWVTAAAPAIGWPAGAFQAVLRERRTEVVHRALDEYPAIWTAMKRLAAASWSGPVSELQDQLGCGSMKPSAFGGLMRRLTPDLEAVGIELKKYRQGHASARCYSVKSVVGIVGIDGMGSEDDAA